LEYTAEVNLLFMPKIELYGTKSCPYTEEMREDLQWRKIDFVEYDVDDDGSAFERMLSLTEGKNMVPVLVEDGRVKQIGWQGRGCLGGKP
jgi:mycoredoxin